MKNNKIINKKNLIIFLGIMVCLLGFVLRNKILEQNYESVMVNSIVSQSNEEIIQIPETNTIKVHIYGAVNNPGLIELSIDSRIYDAIEASGGLTQEADVSKVNLAYMLSDGEKVYIASINDEEVLENANYMQNASSKVNINTANVSQLIQLNGIGESLAEAIVEYRKENGKFKDIEDIKNVSGIGESKFERVKDFICVK